jgi:hypothetical protein
LTTELEKLLPEVLRKTRFNSQNSLHGKIGGKFAQYIDIQNEVINSPEHFISLWLQGYEDNIRKRGDFAEQSTAWETYMLLRRHKVFRDYLFIFLKRVYLRNYQALSKRRPRIEEAEIWIGQENASYGILVTPRFVNRRWENDKSEIRHFKKQYWSIGHILETGFVIPDDNDKMTFKDISEYLKFFRNVLVRNSGSDYEMEIAKMYCNYVRNHERPENIPLLIPEYRYDGLHRKHKYRLDFTIIEPIELNKIGFELSPWSSHGYLKKTKSMTQAEINQLASDNFEREMRKHKDYFKKHGIFALIYTDSDLNDIKLIFNDMIKYMEPKTAGKQLQFHILEDFFTKKLS